MNTQDRPTVPAHASIEEKAYQEVLARRLEIFEAALLVETHKLEALAREAERVAA